MKRRNLCDYLCCVARGNMWRSEGAGVSGCRRNPDTGGAKHWRTTKGQQERGLTMATVSPRIYQISTVHRNDCVNVRKAFPNIKHALRATLVATKLISLAIENSTESHINISTTS